MPNLLLESLFRDVEEKGSYIYLYRFPLRRFRLDLAREYRSGRVLKLFAEIFSLIGNDLKFHRFFAPELLYLLRKLPDRSEYRVFEELLLAKTWLRDTLVSRSSTVDLHEVRKDIVYRLTPYQLEFIETYEKQKRRYNLDGYLLAFEMGLGKTLTSLALMHALGKESIVIVAPKNTLKTVWKNEIETIFRRPQKIWVVGDDPAPARFFLVNYESMDKLEAVSRHIEIDPGIIVDECHNFRNQNAKRVVVLQKLAARHNCQDILLMSGTPIKAIGSEMIPMLYLLDPMFDEEAMKIFVDVFGYNRDVALDVLQNRLGLMMHRKKREDVLDLPRKIEEDVKIGFPGADEFAMGKVKRAVMEFREDREAYYRIHGATYVSEFQECMDYLENEKGLGSDEDFIRYQKILARLRNRKSSFRTDPEFLQEVVWSNKYEKETLYPLLSPELKRKFLKARAVVKYVELKILGEVIGGLLPKLRSKMTAEMMRHSKICSMVKNAAKKTVCFTNFVDVAETAEEYLRSVCRLKPVAIHGKAKTSTEEAVKEFKKGSANPIVATIQSLSTGVTLTEGNTVIFLNSPWRSVDKNQAMDRVYRIGQDRDVYVYTFVLDTGTEPNLSTRMEEIVTWSQEMFEKIVGT